MQQANKLFMFCLVANDAVKVDTHQDGDTLIAGFTSEQTKDVLILSLKQIKGGFYQLAYHVIYGNGEETSQDYSAPFPATMAQDFSALIVDDVFKVA